MSILTNKECAIYGKRMKAIPKIELCAGNKVYIKPLQSYKKHADGRFTKEKQNDTNSEKFYLGESRKKI